MPGNPLQPVILRSPGIGGLNFEGEGLTADPSFAQQADNIVFDQAGRICSRKGFDPTTSGGETLPGTPDIEQLHMMDTSSGNKLLATAGVASIGLDLTGAITVVAGETVTQTTSGATGVVMRTTDLTNNEMVVVSVTGTFDTSNELTGSTSGALGANSVPTAVTAFTNNIYESSPSFDEYTDVTGGLTYAANNWQFQNFDDKVVAVQTGETMVVKSYSGNFARITAASGTVPDGNCVHSAFGRLWAQQGDGAGQRYIVAYSALLDETHWTTGAGEINVLGNAGAVSKGYDEVVAISSYDNYLVVFMRDSIVIYNSPDVPGSLGIQQIIQGVGCIARDSVQQTGDDVVWLSSTGLRSLRHTVQSENNLELGDLSANVRGELQQKVSQISGDVIRSAYYPEDALYTLKTGNVIWAMDLHDRSAIGQAPPKFTKFPNNEWQSLYYHEGSLYIGSNGKLGIYQNYQDDGTAYNMIWKTVWTDFGTSRLKSIKKMNSVVVANSNQNVTFQWETDYGLSSGSATATTEGAGTTAEWNVGEWGLSEWSGGTTLSRLSVQGSRTGEVLAFGFNITVDSNQVCIEQLGIYTTIGREAR
jgi:hypothetical protein